MNWTGGARVRHNRPSSNTNRLQKRYFAKVRAAQSSIHPVGPHPVFGVENSASGYVKRKRLPIPALDIIVSKDGDTSQGTVVKRRKLLGTFHGVRSSTPASSVRSFGDVSRGSGRLRTKKQLLLETDDWVCTTLARPLVLKNQVNGPNRGSRTATVKVTKPLGLDLCEPPPIPVRFNGVRGAESEPRIYNTPVYPSPKKQAHPNAGEDGRCGRAFRNLSGGGYVQIGGSTQAGNRAATQSSFGGRGSIEREMSGISEETMLFDLGRRQERYDTPPQPSPFSTQPMPRKMAIDIFGNEHQVPLIQDGSEDIVYYSRDPHWGRVGRGADQFPSSPLAPYSQNIHNQGTLISRNHFLAGSQESADSLIGEIEKAVADTDPNNSPVTILPTIDLRPEPVTPPRHLQISLSPAGSDRNSEYQGRSYPIYDHHQVLAPNKQNLFELNLLHEEEETESTQNLSLMAYASSSGSSFANDDGESWMLGLNSSLELYEGYDVNTNVPPGGSGDDWETFLGHGVLTSKGVEQEEVRDDAQKYLDQVGIWEKQPLELGDQALIEGQFSDDEGECCEFYNRGADVVPVTVVPNMATDSGDLTAVTSSLCLWPEGDKITPCRDPPEETYGVEDGGVGEKSFTQKQSTAEQRLESCEAHNETTVGTSGVAPQSH